MKNYKKNYKLNFLENQELTDITRKLLFEYCICKDIHPFIHINFEELLKAIFIKIDTYNIIIKNIVFKNMNNQFNNNIILPFTDRFIKLIKCLSLL